MITQFNTDENFWKLYPDFKVMEPFVTLYTEDKSKEKLISSTIMWGIALAESHESSWYNLNDKYQRIKEDFIKSKDLDWSIYESHIQQFKETQLSQAEKSLTAWNELMSKRDRYLKNQEYYFDEYKMDPNTGDTMYSKTGAPILVKGTAEQLDKAYSTTPKMYSDYDKIKKMLAEEKTIISNSDNESLGDQGLL